MSKSKVPGLGASVAGASAGTGLLGLVQLIPNEHQQFRSVLVLLTPALTVILSIVWENVTGVLKIWLRRARVEWTLKEARKQRDQVMGSRFSTDAHKADVQSRCETLEKLLMALIDDETSSIRVTLGAS